MLDIHSGQDEDCGSVYPTTVLTSSEDGGYLKLRRIDADRLHVEAGNEHSWGKTECYVHFNDNPAFLFAEMASEWRGWEGTKEWADREGALQLAATVDSLGHVSLDVELRGTDCSSRLRITLVVDAGQLEDIAGRVAKAVPTKDPR